jgi:hypothetical protein
MSVPSHQNSGYSRFAASDSGLEARPIPTLPDSPAALVIGHPGHELRVHGWMEHARPQVFVLMAVESRERTVPVVDDLGKIAVAPDIIHGQSNHELITALLRFPATRAIRICHSWKEATALAC